MDCFERIVRSLSGGVSYIAQVALALMMFLVVGNVLMRFIWRPIPGTFEIVCLLGAVVIFMAVAYCAAMKGHVAIGVLVERFSPRIQAVIDSITSLITLIVIGIVSWQMFAFATRMWQRGYATADLAIPYPPFIYGAALGLGALCLVLLVEFCKSLLKAVRKQ